jgi:hypothetical protein
LPKLWRLIKAIFKRIGSWLGLCEPPAPLAAEAALEKPEVKSSD